MGRRVARNWTRKQDLERQERRAWRYDTIALHLARGRPAIDVALGEIFLRLGVGDRLIELGYSRKVDFANEALGMPPRTFFALEELARGLRDRLLLRQAVVTGEVSTVKARIAIKADAGIDEGALTTAAMEMTVRQLRKLLKAEDQAPPTLRTSRWNMTARQQDRLDAAISLAKELVGYDAPDWKLQARIAREYIEAEGKEEEASVEEAREGNGRASREGDSSCRQLEAHFDACELLGGDPSTDNALGLQALAKRLVARRERFDEPLGRALFVISAERLWRRLEYRTFGDYCRERLGISESTAKQRIRLETRLKKLPPLRKALLSGRITYTKALQVARHATPATVEDLILEASETTFQQTKESADRVEKQTDRENGERKMRGPAAALDLVGEAIALARQKFAAEGEDIDDGEAWARVSDWFFRRWEKPLKRADWRTKWEKEVLFRTGGLCAVPGCTRAADDVHHIVFRSKGGPDIPVNGVAACRSHHQHGIHRKTLIVRGRGGEHLVWVFKARAQDSGDLIPIAEWETYGKNVVRRRGTASRRGAA